MSPEHLREVVADIVAVEADDGIEFDLDSLAVQEIRDDADYPGLRLRMKARLATWNGVTAWDVSTGDPIVPMPQQVRLPRIHGADILVLGYRPETTIAEKGVTILERGTTSTRWRDYVDIVQLFEHFDVDREMLAESVRAVAAHRKVELGPVGPLLVGYGEVAQPSGQPGGARSALRRSASRASTSRSPRWLRCSIQSSRPARNPLLRRLRQQS